MTILKNLLNVECEMGLFRDVFADYIFKDYSTNWFGERYIKFMEGRSIYCARNNRNDVKIFELITTTGG